MTAIPQYFLGESKKFLEKLPLESLTLDADLAHIEAPGGTIRIESYHCEKFEKIVLSTIAIHKTRVTDETLIMWPDDFYNFPALWFTLTTMPPVMNVCILDTIPLMDPVIFPDYAKTYIQGTKDLKAKAYEILGDTILEREVDLPTRSVYAFSPYRVVVNVSSKGLERLPRVVNTYLEAYTRLWQGAKKISEKITLDFYLKKKTATKRLIKGNDPGYPIMAEVFGKEKTSRVFDVVF